MARRFVLSLSLLFSAIITTVIAVEPVWKAGTARVNITPDQPMWMAGYGGRDRPAAGKLIDLWGKALVLEDDTGHRGVLITLDLVGMDRELSMKICGLLAENCQLDRSQIALCMSHTHTGPVVGENLSPLHYRLVSPQQQALIDQYAEELCDKVVMVVKQAITQLSTSELTWGSGQAMFAVNRRNNSEKEVPRLRVANQLVGPVDHDVPVLAVRDAEQQLMAIVFGYACHATVLNLYQWSGDYPGFAQLELEAKHPGCLALFFAGCGADQNPLPRRSIALAQHYGRRLADAVDTVLLTTAMKPVASHLRTRFREVDLMLDNLPTRAQLERDARSKNKFVVSRAKMLLQQLDQGVPLSPVYPYPIGTWKLGHDIELVTLGGEVVVDYALRLKSELAGSKTWVAAYAHDVMAYIPSRRVLREGGYEGNGSMLYYGLPTVWTPAVENTIVTEVHQQLDPR